MGRQRGFTSAAWTLNASSGARLSRQRAQRRYAVYRRPYNTMPLTATGCLLVKPSSRHEGLLSPQWNAALGQRSRHKFKGPVLRAEGRGRSRWPPFARPLWLYSDSLRRYCTNRATLMLREEYGEPYKTVNEGKVLSDMRAVHTIIV